MKYFNAMIVMIIWPLAMQQYLSKLAPIVKQQLEEDVKYKLIITACTMCNLLYNISQGSISLWWVRVAKGACHHFEWIAFFMQLPLCWSLECLIVHPTASSFISCSVSPSMSTNHETFSRWVSLLNVTLSISYLKALRCCDIFAWS